MIGGTFILGNFRPLELSFLDTHNYGTPFPYVVLIVQQKSSNFVSCARCI